MLFFFLPGGSHHHHWYELQWEGRAGQQPLGCLHQYQGLPAGDWRGFLRLHPVVQLQHESVDA